MHVEYQNIQISNIMDSELKIKQLTGKVITKGFISSYIIASLKRFKLRLIARAMALAIS